MPTLIEERQKLEAKQTELTTKFDGYAVKTLADGTTAKDIPASDIEGIRKLHDEINELGKSVESLRAADEADREARKALDEKNKKIVPDNTLAHGAGPDKGGKPVVKAMSDELYGSEQFKNRGKRNMDEVELRANDSNAEFKTLMTTTADGYPPEIRRDGTVVPIIMRPPQLIDFLRIEPTDQNGIKFMKQTVRTNNALAKAEGAALDEAVITYAESTDIISRIGVTIPVTEEELEDEPGLRSLVDNDLILMVRQELDRQVTVGSGAAPVLRGIFNATSIQTQAKGADPTFDTAMKGITKVRVTGRAQPNLFVFHSNDWQEIALTRTADGIYILGNPQNMPDLRLWGLPVALSEALTEGNGLVVDTSYFVVKMRKGVTVAITDSHASEFIANILRIRAHVRAGLKKMRDEAACTLTGI